MTARTDSQLPPAPGGEGAREPVPACPACGGTQRTTLHEGLADLLCGTPGRWTLQRCAGCGSAYLDPRPGEDAVAALYADYFTHLPDAAPSARVGWAAALANGYRNRRYGTRLAPASAAGWLAVTLLPPWRRYLDRSMRHLPDEPGRLLDVGAGNGAFLVRARSAGWTVRGLEPDAQACALARQAGLDVAPGDDLSLAQERGPYDALTLSNVLEHVRDPRRLLGHCHRLLRPGGSLWIETPNIESLGHRVYGKCWRGLEPPRHFTVFSEGGLTGALHAAGFRRIRPLHVPLTTYFMYRESERLRGSSGLHAWLRSRAWMLVAEAISPPSRRNREFLTVLAQRDA